MTALDNEPRTDADDKPFFLTGNFAPGLERTDRCGPAGHRVDPDVAVGPLPAQRIEPVLGHRRPLVLRRRHGARRPPRRRQGGVVPQPLRADDEAREGTRGHGSRGHVRPDGQCREHPRARPRRTDLGARGGPPPLRAEPRARHARLRRLRRQAHDGVHRAPEAVPRDRRTALLRLLAAARRS